MPQTYRPPTRPKRHDADMLIHAVREKTHRTKSDDIDTLSRAIGQEYAMLNALKGQRVFPADYLESGLKQLGEAAMIVNPYFVRENYEVKL